MRKLTDKQKERIIKGVIKDFDFKKVHKIMTLLDWEWRGKVPTIDDLKYQAKKLLENVMYDDHCWGMGTGGFYVHKTEETVNLVFILENAEWGFMDVNK